MARLIRNTRQQAAPRAAVRHLVDCQHDGRFDSTVEPAAISDLIQQKDQIVWVDLQHPRPEDLALLSEEFGFHPLAIEDATYFASDPRSTHMTGTISWSSTHCSMMSNNGGCRLSR